MPPPLRLIGLNYKIFTLTFSARRAKEKKIYIIFNDHWKMCLFKFSYFQLVKYFNTLVSIQDEILCIMQSPSETMFPSPPISCSVLCHFNIKLYIYWIFYVSIISIIFSFVCFHLFFHLFLTSQKLKVFSDKYF